jgi:uncharacterized membrane protein
VIGGITVLRVISKVAKVAWTDKRVRSSLKILSVYFVIFFLYQTGFVFYVAEGQTSSISLNSSTDDCHNEQEVLGAMWLNGVKDSNRYIYADKPRWLLLCSRLGFLGRECPLRFTVNNINRTQKGSYIYFGTLNAVRHKGAITHIKEVTAVIEYIDIGDIVDSRSKIYINGGCEIYK